jgi:hypothetical protein
MKLRGKFVLLIGVAGCATALTVASLMSGLSMIKVRSPQHLDSKASVENLAEVDATMISLRQQAVSALANLQGAAVNHP